MPLTAIGDSAQTRILKHESHKLHHEFTVKAANSVRIGMPVKLDAAGTIVPLVLTDEEHLCIGYCMQDAAADEYVTVAMRGYTILFAETQGALAAGPVQIDDFGSQPLDLPEFVVAATNVLTVGWNLDNAAGANEQVRILMRD